MAQKSEIRENTGKNAEKSKSVKIQGKGYVRRTSVLEKMYVRRPSVLTKNVRQEDVRTRKKMYVRRTSVLKKKVRAEDVRTQKMYVRRTSVFQRVRAEDRLSFSWGFSPIWG